MKRALLVAAALAACGGSGGGQPDAGAQSLPYAQLSDYRFFQGNGSTQEPVEGVVPYTVNAALFADFAAKRRFIVLPGGGKIGYEPDAKWHIPTGAMIVKTFAYGDRLIETRILINQPDGWLPTTYLWNDAQTEATLLLTGARAHVTYIDASGASGTLEYRVPNQNQCYGCHGQPGPNETFGKASLLGVRTRQLDRLDEDGTTNQIDRMAALGMFQTPPPPAVARSALPDPYAPGPVEPRARAWLEANCAHCHSPDGAAGATNLFLASDVSNPIDYGVCRPPNAAGAGSGGRKVDILPGKPDDSVMTFRIESIEPGIKMPEMPVQLVDTTGAAVVRQWIGEMPATGCAH